MIGLTSCYVEVKYFRYDLWYSLPIYTRIQYKSIYEPIVCYINRFFFLNDNKVLMNTYLQQQKVTHSRTLHRDELNVIANGAVRHK